MSDHPTTGVGAPEPPTTQTAACRQQPADTAGGLAVPRRRPAPSPDSAPSAGFPAPSGRETAPPTAPGPARDAALGFHAGHRNPRGVDPTAFGGLLQRPGRRRLPRTPQRLRYRPEHLPHTPLSGAVHRHAAAAGQAAAVGGLAPAALRLSGHLINLGESPRADRYNNLVAQVNRPLRGCYRIAMLSLKGGVGKTTITATLGATFASIRGDRVVAVDANPDRGTLSQKIPLETAATVRQLLHDAGTHRALQRRPPLHLEGPQRAGSAGVGKRSGYVGGVQRRRLQRAPWTSSSGSTAWCSPTAAPGCCIR